MDANEAREMLAELGAMGDRNEMALEAAQHATKLSDVALTMARESSRREKELEAENQHLKQVAARLQVQVEHLVNDREGLKRRLETVHANGGARA